MRRWYFLRLIVVKYRIEQLPKKTEEKICVGVNLKFFMIQHGDALVKCVNNVEYMNNLQVCASRKMLYPLYLSTCLEYVQFYITDFMQVADYWESKGVHIIEHLPNRCDGGGVKTSEAEEKTVGTLL